MKKLVLESSKKELVGYQKLLEHISNNNREDYRVIDNSLPAKGFRTRSKFQEDSDQNLRVQSLINESKRLGTGFGYSKNRFNSENQLIKEVLNR